MMTFVFFTTTTTALAGPSGASKWRSLPVDPSLTVLNEANFGAVGDGKADDTAAFEKAIAGQGSVVMVPSGTYRITRSIKLPKGKRMIGYGETRPEIVLASNTPGWSGEEKKALIIFAAQSEKHKGNDTFYTAFDNVNLRIEPGNPSAYGVNFDAAQGSYVANAQMRLSEGNIGIRRLGSEITNVQIFGGKHAITGGTVSWQTLIVDCEFRGQSDSALLVTGIGPTMIRSVIADTPKGVVIVEGKVDRIYAEDCLFENIVGALIECDRRSAIHFANCSYVRVRKLAVFADAAGVESPQELFHAESFVYGLRIDVAEHQGQYKRTDERGAVLGDIAPPRTGVPDTDFMHPILLDEYRSVKDFGAKGDGKSDDTEAIKAAVASASKIYFPTGNYVVSKPIQLDQDTHVLGLHPRATMLRLQDNNPWFSNRSKPRGIIETPVDGTNVVVGIGFDPKTNPGATTIIWRSGQDSYLGDWWIRAGKIEPIGERQFAAIWIDGGGGVFKNLWSGDRHSPVGLKITNTSVPSRMYLISMEHKRGGREVVLENVANWAFYALQTEHYVPAEEFHDTVPIDVHDCKNLMFANLYLYRTTGSKRRSELGLDIYGSSDIDVRGIRSFHWRKMHAKRSVMFHDWDIDIPERGAAWIQYGIFVDLFE
ncbi:MAG: glycosyl hydrolase family 28-related protein [Planctomycetota bacterium]